MPDNTPFGAVAGDLNSDGRPDIVSPGDGGVTVYFSSATGYWPPQRFLIPCQYGSQAVALGDVDADGWLDVVATCRYANATATEGAFVVLWGTGQGYFGNPTYTPTFVSANYPLTVTLGDSGSGRLDVVLARSDSGDADGVRLARWTNNGDRTFSASTNVSVYAIGNVINRQMVSADFDGDGIADFAIASDVRVVVISGHLTTVLGSISYAQSVHSNRSIAAGDFDRDGRTDLVVGTGDGRLDFWRNANQTSGVQQYWNGSTWLTSPGMATLNFTAAGSISTQPTANMASGVPSYIAVADLNRDGWLDVASANSNGALPYGGTVAGTVTVALGGPAGFSELAGSPIAVGNISPNGIVAGDLNNDGLLDLLVPDSSGPNKPVVLYNGFPVLTTAPSSLTFWASLRAAGAVSPAPIPLTVTGSTTTPVITNTISQPWITTTEETGAGPGTPFSVAVNASSLTPGTSRGTTTFSAEGFSSATANVTVRAARPSGTLQGPTTVFAPNDRPYQSLITGDVNGDGHLDAVLGGRTLLSNGAGAFTDVANALGFRGYERGSTLTADFNRDGKLDVAYTDFNSLTIALGDGTGTYLSPRSQLVPAPSGASTAMTGLVAGDFDNDGYIDLLAADGGQAKRFLLFPGTPQGRFGAARTIGAPSIPGCPSCFFLLTRLASGDFNGDGRLDFIAATNNGAFLTMLGTPSAAGFAPTPDSNQSNCAYCGQGNASVQSLTVADMNRDGIDDVIVGYARNSTPRAAIRVLGGNTSLGAAGGGFAVGAVVSLADASFGVEGQQLIIADVNGDGNPDVVEMHAQSTTFVVARGNGVGQFSSVTTYDTQHPFQGNYGGADFAGLGAGDVNGDGRTDLLVLQTAATCTPTCATTRVYSFVGAQSTSTATLVLTGDGTAPYGGTAPAQLTVADGATGSAVLQEGGAAIGVSGQTVGPWSFPLGGLAVGAHTVTAQYGGDESFAPSTSNAVTITVTRATGILTMVPTIPATAGEPVTLTATLAPASAGGLVTFFAGPTALGSATMNGLGSASLTTAALPAGAHVITAQFAGDANVFPAISAGVTQVINAPPMSVVLGPLQFAYDGQPKPVAAATLPAGGTVVVTYDGSTTVPTNVGSYAVIATIDGQGVLGSATGTLVITKGVATITLGSLTQTVDGLPKPVSVSTLPGGLTVTVTYDGQATPPSAIGNYSVSATVNDANWAGSATGTLIVAEPAVKTPTLTRFFFTEPANGSTFGQSVQFYFVVNQATGVGPNLPTGTITVRDGALTLGTVPVDMSQGAAAFATSALGGGARQLTATYSGDTYNAASVSELFTYTVNKASASVTLTAAHLSQVYSGVGKVVEATPSPAGLSVVVTYNGNSTPPVNAGTYAVVATINDQNYSGSVAGTLVINKAAAPYQFRASDLSQTFDGGAKVVNIDNKPVGTVVSVTYAGSATGPINAGSYAVSASSPNYQTIATTLVVNRAAAGITLYGLLAIADGTPKVVTPVTAPLGLSYSLVYKSGAATLSGPPSSAGLYTVTATITNPNYLGSATGTLDIHAKNNTVTTMAPATGTYGTPTALTATVTFAPITGRAPTGAVQFLEGTKLVASTYIGSGGVATAVAWLTAGPHTITARYVGDGENVGSAASPQTVSVAKAAPSFTFNNLSHVYDGLAKTVTVTTNVGNITPTVTYAPASPKAVGSYTVTASVNTENYQGTASATLVITKAPATVHLGTNVFTFDNTAKAAQATTTPAGRALTFTYANVNTGVTTTTAPRSVGVYTVVATINDPNYTGSASGPLQIVGRGTATVTISGPTAVNWSGDPQGVTVSTQPRGLAVRTVYTNLTDPAQPQSTSAPTGAGVYAVNVTVTDPDFTGSAASTFTINGQITLGADTLGSQVLLDGVPLSSNNNVATPVRVIRGMAPGWHRISALDYAFRSNTSLAAPDSNNAFTSWSDGGAATHDIFVAGGPQTYIATYRSQHALNVKASPQGLVSTSTCAECPPAPNTLGGTVTRPDGTPVPVSGFVDDNSVVVLKANPAPGFKFSSWSKDGQFFSFNQAQDFTTDAAAHTWVANFTPLKPELTFALATGQAPIHVPFGSTLVPIRATNVGSGVASNISVTFVSVTVNTIATGEQYCYTDLNEFKLLDPRDGYGFFTTSGMDKCDVRQYNPQVTLLNLPSGFGTIQPGGSSVSTAMLKLDWPPEALRITVTIHYSVDGAGHGNKASFTINR